MDNENEIIAENLDNRKITYTGRELKEAVREAKAHERKLCLARMAIVALIALPVGWGAKAAYDWSKENKQIKAGMENDEFFSEYDIDSFSKEDQHLLNVATIDGRLKEAIDGELFRVKILTAQYCGYPVTQAGDILYLTERYDKENGVYVGVRVNPDGTTKQYSEFDPVEWTICNFAIGVSNAHSLDELNALNGRFGEVINTVNRASYEQVDHMDTGKSFH